VKSALLLTLALVSSKALADDGPRRELAPGAGAVHVQEGRALLLEPDGSLGAEVRLPAGVFYTLPGHQRLTAAFSQLQAERVAGQARADALQQALTLRSAPPASGVGTGAVVVVAVLLLVSGGAVGFALAR